VIARRRDHLGVVLAIILTGYLLILIDVSILMAALPRIPARHRRRVRRRRGHLADGRRRQQ
jgi:hypothetical protein